MKHNLTVAILIGSMERGGAQRMALYLWKKLHEKGLPSYLVLLDYNQEMLLDELGKNAINTEWVFSLAFSNVRWNTAVKAAFMIKQAISLYRHIQRKQIAVTISFMERANILSLAIPGNFRRILSVRKHLEAAFKDKDPLKRALIKTGYTMLLRRADTVVFNARESSIYFSNLFDLPKAKTRIIYNFCDIDLLNRKAGESLSPDHASYFSRKTIVTVGRLVEAKGHYHLIKAFSLLEEYHRDWFLLIVGDGPLRGELEGLIDRFGLAGYVTLTGYVANPMPLIKRSEIFVLPSKAEGFPNALLEAMALGRPVISTDCPSGPREILAPETDPLVKTRTVEQARFGILVPYIPSRGITYAYEKKFLSEELALAEALKIMIEDETLRNQYGRVAFERAKEFHPDTIVNEWIRLFQEERG